MTTTASRKAKGRKLQQLVRDHLRATGKSHSLQDGDIVSTSMGVSGVDIQLSPQAKKVLGDLAIECKAQETLNVVGEFLTHQAKYHKDETCILVHRKNHTEALCTIEFSYFMEIFDRLLFLERYLSAAA